MNDIKNFTISYSPHVTDSSTVTRIMLDVIIALIPACAAAIYYFGISAAVLMAVSVGTAIASEVLIQWICKRPITVSDGSAALTGLLLALNLPVGVPVYVPVIGAVFAIGVVKQCFGGLGHNFVNPALAARAMLLVAFPVAMTSFVLPGVDAVASATPLAMIKLGETGSLPTIWQMAIGNTGGSMGETCAIALLIGGIYLMIRKVIDWRIPVSFIATVALFTWILKGSEFLLYYLLGGGLFLGAIFMATDYVTSPTTPWGKIVFGIGCGALTALIRVFGSYNEGVCFSILLMNLVVPLLEKAFRPRVFGKAAAK